MISRVDAEVLIDLRWRVLHPGAPRSAARMQLDRAPSSRHWAISHSGEVVGAVSVFELRGWALRGMAVAPELQRRGLGRRLLDAVHAEVAAPMWCNARLAAVPFYAAAGWQAVGPVFDLDGPHQRMVWAPR